MHRKLSRVKMSCQTSTVCTWLNCCAVGLPNTLAVTQKLMMMLAPVSSAQVMKMLRRENGLGTDFGCSRHQSHWQPGTCCTPSTL